MDGISRVGGLKGGLMTLPRMILEHVLESAPDAVVGLDEGGVNRLVHRLTETLFGYGRDDLVGTPVEMLVPGHARPDLPGHWENFVADGRTRHMGSG